MDDLLEERVLRCVECVPSGRVVTYGQVAAVVGTGARQVGAVMARAGGAVQWWRVVNARGELPIHLRGRARGHWSDEGVAVRGEALAVDLGRHRMDPAELGAAYERATLDLPALPSRGWS